MSTTTATPLWNSNTNENIKEINNNNSMFESNPIYPTAPTTATNKRFLLNNNDNFIDNIIDDEPIQLSPPASPSPSIINFNEKRSYTTPYIKQDIIIPTPVSTPDSFHSRQQQREEQQTDNETILKRHSTISSIPDSIISEDLATAVLKKTLRESPSTVSLGRHHTTGHTLKSARQRMADKERLSLMRRSEEFQKELSARRKTFKRLSRLMDSNKEEPEEDRVLMGTRISEGHQNYVLMYNMLTGIRIAVSRVTAKVDRPLTDEDFVAAHKLAFDVVGDELTPGAKYDFKFKDYAPWVFRHLREKFGVDPADYLVRIQ
jgi:1-phosphatidylinositol-4-phosphate 5-kinase